MTEFLTFSLVTTRRAPCRIPLATARTDNFLRSRLLMTAGGRTAEGRHAVLERRLQTGGYEKRCRKEEASASKPGEPCRKYHLALPFS